MHHLIPRFAELSAIVAVLGVLVTSCEGDARVETETHFLAFCEGDCPSGLTCVCGVCTEACASDGECGKYPGEAICVSTPGACGGTVASTCDVECSGSVDCRALGMDFACVAGLCRASSTPDAGAGGASAGGRSNGGANAGGSSAGAGGASSGGAGGPDAGGGCSQVGAPCCDPFPGDGPNFCQGGLVCGAGNTCEVDCDCALGAYRPACGVDGTTYDATCGDACVPVAIACSGECPCRCTVDLGTGCSEISPGTGATCCAGLECCQGVPYDLAGECRPSCDFISDRDQKTDIRPADTRAVLETVAALPISTWRYRAEPGARHVGPMAQDFAAGFGLGSSDRVIAGVDASGVALASIQALYERVEGLARENEALRQRVRTLEAGTAKVTTQGH